MQDPLKQLENTYFTLQSQINMLAAACPAVQRDALTAQYVQARQNYWACVNKAFHDDDPQVINLTSQVVAANQQLSEAIRQIDDIASTMKAITSAVTLGTQLAEKVITI